MPDAPDLPARVRVSRLPGSPGMALLAQLERLAAGDGGADLGSRLAALGPDRDCWVALAGGRPVALLLVEREGGVSRRSMALEPSWKGRGLEQALIQAASDAP